MNSYLNIISKYLSAHKKKKRLAIMSVAIAVALVTGVFSMLDLLSKYEKIQIIKDYGNYHIMIKNPTEEEITQIESRIDVNNSGTFTDFGKGVVYGNNCSLASIDERLTNNFGMKILEGKFPMKENEVILEQWTFRTLWPDLKIGDTIRIKLPDHKAGEFVISGIYNDLATLKAKSTPGIFFSNAFCKESSLEHVPLYVVEFKEGTNLRKVIDEIKTSLNIDKQRFGTNERLIAISGQSTNKSAISLYATGAVLFFIVLMAGVLMIYNAFNISVNERIRQFGLLRCIGASKAQIKKLVRREGLIISIRAIPIGISAGILMGFACSAILKYRNSNMFEAIPVFTVSPVGICAGIVIGFLTVMLASYLPARKASRISPVNAVTGSNDIKIRKGRKKGLLTKAFHVEYALGINNATMKKKTFLLMVSSLSVSIILFFGFQVFINLLYSGMNMTKPYSPDISIISEKGIAKELFDEIARIDGVKRVYGRMFDHVEATFAADKLNEQYKKIVGNITADNNGLLVQPERSWLISYDKNQLNWAKEDLVEGTLNEEELNQNGVIAVLMNLRKGIGYDSVKLETGDKVYVTTADGRRELTVKGVLRSVPFSDSELNLTTFITTEEVFKRLSERTDYDIEDIQLMDNDQEAAVERISKLVGKDYKIYDSRQKHSENDQTFLTMAVFIYGFIIVIALISILNIINTMNTSIASKTRYFGVMRAVGMSGKQLVRMVLSEAAIQSLCGCITGCVLGILLQKVLITQTLSWLHAVWRFPFEQILIIVFITMMITVISVIGPLKRIRAMGVSEVISQL